MAERGYYGNALRVQASSGGQQASMMEPSPDYGELGAVLGIGTLIGIVIGSNITFHLPVKKRR